MLGPSSLFVAVLLLAGGGSALRCYECDSQNSARCSDPFSASSAERLECGAQSPWGSFPSIMPGLQTQNHQGQNLPNFSPVCVKAVYYVPNRGTHQTHRTCMTFGTGACTLLQGQLPAGSRLEECQACSGELCNAAPRGLAAAPLLALLLASSLPIFFKMA